MRVAKSVSLGLLGVAVALLVLFLSSLTGYADDAASGRLAQQVSSKSLPPRISVINPSLNIYPTMETRMMPRYVLLKHEPTPTEAGYFSLVIGAEIGNDFKNTCVSCLSDPHEATFEQQEAALNKYNAENFNVSIAFDDGQQIRMTKPSVNVASDRKPQPYLAGSHGVEIRLPPGAKRIVRVEIFVVTVPYDRHAFTLPSDPQNAAAAKAYPTAGPAWPRGYHPWIWPLNVAVAAGVVPGAVPVLPPPAPAVPNGKKAAMQNTGPGSPAYEAAQAVIAAMLAALAALFGLTIITPAVEDPDQALIDDDGLRLPARRKKGMPPPEEHWTSPLPPTDGGQDEHWTSLFPPETPRDGGASPAPLGEDGLPPPGPPKVKLAPPPEHWAQPQPPPEEHWAQPQPAPTTQEAPGTGAPDAQAGRDEANKPPTGDLHMREKPGTGTGDPEQSRDAAADPVAAGAAPVGSLPQKMDPVLRDILDRQKAGDPTAAADLKAYKASIADKPPEFMDSYMRAVTGWDTPNPAEAKGTALAGARKLGTGLEEFADKTADGVAKNLGQIKKAGGIVADLSTSSEGLKNLWGAVKDNAIVNAFKAIPTLFKGGTDTLADGIVQETLGDNPGKRLAEIYRSTKDGLHRWVGDPEAVQDTLAKGTTEVIGNVVLAKADHALGDLTGAAPAIEKAVSEKAGQSALEEATARPPVPEPPPIVERIPATEAPPAPKVDPEAVTRPLPVSDAPVVERPAVSAKSDIAAAKTGRFEASPQSSGARAASDSAASPKTAKFETAEMPGDKPTGPRGTERLEPKDLPDGGKDPGPGVERGPDGRHPVRMTREEARVRLGENIDPPSPRPAGAEAPTPELPRDLPKTKLPETAARPPAELPETTARPRPELPETAARDANLTADTVKTAGGTAREEVGAGRTTVKGGGEGRHPDWETQKLGPDGKPLESPETGETKKLPGGKTAVQKPDDKELQAYLDQAKARQEAADRAAQKLGFKDAGDMQAHGVPPRPGPASPEGPSHMTLSPEDQRFYSWDGAHEVSGLEVRIKAATRELFSETGEPLTATAKSFLEKQLGNDIAILRAKPPDWWDQLYKASPESWVHLRQFMPK